jgi:hypothetical protein
MSRARLKEETCGALDAALAIGANLYGTSRSRQCRAFNTNCQMKGKPTARAAYQPIPTMQ